jgi:RNA polymerase sigma-54 factor
MALEQKITVKLAQKLIMTPSLQQAIKLLQMSKLELQEEITQELVENPVLEEVTTEEKESSEKSSGEESPQEETAEDKQKEDIDYEAFFEHFDEPVKPRYHREEKEESFAIESLLTKPKTLSDHLLWQLNLSTSSELQQEIGEAIIGNLNEDGYLRATLEEIRDFGNFPMKQIEDTLLMIQEFDPVGVAARDLKECLNIQLKVLGVTDKAIFEIVEHHLRKLQSKRYKELASELGCSMKRLQQYIDIIKGLDPKPGRKYSTEKSQYVTPDVYVLKLENEYVIQLNDEGLPKLKISTLYKKMLDKGSNEGSEDAKEFIKGKIRSAFRLIKSLDERQRTILRVAKSIVSMQRDFFDYGIERLKPMVLRDVADDIGVHESTVSRVVNNKYMHSPRGLFELRFFFHSGLTSFFGEDVSSLSVKERIKKYIEEENPKKPLSDASIAKTLSEEGLKIARRTVAKYREEMRIPPSSIRRQRFQEP